MKTVIIIDDDLDDLEMMRYVFGKADPNIHCISFNNPVEALEQLCEGRSIVPDYIFIDINMPIMPGPECLVELRKVKELKDAPIIMFSTSMTEKDTNNLMKNGATFTFRKPFDLAGYIEILKDITLIKSIK